MKPLLDYLNKLSAEDRESFAHRCGTSFDYLRQIGYGNRKCTPSLAIFIDKESGSEVRCTELCPDFNWQLAAELAAPEPQEAKAAA